MKEKTHKFMIEVTVPSITEEGDSVLSYHVKEYITEAVECYGGQLHPDDPFFNLRGKVNVVAYRRPRERRHENKTQTNENS